jgi:hypothetical protein
MDGAAAAPPNDTCSSAQTVAVGNAYMGTTCGGDDSVDNGCAPTGTLDVFYQMQVMAGQDVTFQVTNGFAITIEGCQASSATCVGTSGSTAQTGALGNVSLAIERSAGGCGAFTLTVN